MIDLGHGTPIVLVPGIQGRWEWMLPTVEAVAARARAISYSLCGDRGSGCRLEEARGFGNFVAQLDSVLDHAGVQQAAICGISFGGLIAFHYAAVRPDRVSSLVLASALGPGWRPDARLTGYLRAPRLRAPLFAVRSLRVVTSEVARALPRRRDRWAFRRRHFVRILRAPSSPVRMAQRMKLALKEDFAADGGKVTAPTLLITGERELDRVVAVESTREYLACIPGARVVTLEGTGHIGLVTRPDRFAELVCGFVESHALVSRPEGRNLHAR